VSLPATCATIPLTARIRFSRSKSGRIAVKVINHHGDDAMKVFRVLQQAMKVFRLT